MDWWAAILRIDRFHKYLAVRRETGSLYRDKGINTAVRSFIQGVHSSESGGCVVELTEVSIRGKIQSAVPCIPLTIFWKCDRHHDQ